MIRKSRDHTWRQCKPHNGQPKLTEQQVREIICALQTHRATQRELAFMFKVRQPTIWRIWNKKSYKHVWDSITDTTDTNNSQGGIKNDQKFRCL